MCTNHLLNIPPSVYLLFVDNGQLFRVMGYNFGTDSRNLFYVHGPWVNSEIYWVGVYALSHVVAGNCDSDYMKPKFQEGCIFSIFKLFFEYTNFTYYWNLRINAVNISRDTKLHYKVCFFYLNLVRLLLLSYFWYFYWDKLNV